MSVEFKSVEIINALRQKVEETTGESHADLTEAVQALIDGYGNTEGGSGSSESFVGVKYSNFDLETKLPTVADARSLDGNGIWSDRMVYGLFWNNSANASGGMNVRLKEIYMPSEPTNLSYTFSKCFNLENVYGNLENVKNIVTAFDGCSALIEVPYMPNLITIGANTFRDCTSLTSLKIYKTLTTFHATAFTGCANLTDIYVPWAEGEVANAPWGAPNENLVIHYNTVYDENHNPIVSE